MIETDINHHQDSKDDMLPEYEFKGRIGIRGKYYKMYQRGHKVRIQNEDGIVTVLDFTSGDGQDSKS